MLELFNKKDEILKYISLDDYNKGKNYYLPYIEYLKKIEEEDYVLNQFKVESERTNDIYKCNIVIDAKNHKISRFHCDCYRFEITSSCKHIAACLNYYYDDLFPKETAMSYKQRITHEIFDILSNATNKTKNVKQEVKIEIELSGTNDSNYYDDTLDICLIVGINKLYSCKDRKLSKFLDAIKNNEKYEFGKYFCYNPDTCYFSNQNKELIDFLIILNENRDSRYSNYILLDNNNKIKRFMNISNNTKYKLNGYVINTITDKFPFKSNLKKDKNNYKLLFNIDNNTNFITSDLEYIQIKNTVYHLKEKDRILLLGIITHDMDEFIFNEDDKDKFKDYVLPIIKNDINIDGNINIKISKEIKAKLYFDIYEECIICNLIISYDNTEINYFDNNPNILRDKEYEDKVIEEVIKYNFYLNNNKIILDEINSIGEFLDFNLLELTKKYETYTSEKIKKINIIRHNSVKSTFSIGKSGIMSYNFDLGNISKEEITNVLDSLKNNKKYYRLKSGDILDLSNNNDLIELDRLASNMNISYKEIEKGSGEIPKYRAIYLDSLKNKNYHIIKTNNLFNELIDNFKKYKDSNISLSKKDEQILREYQITGVKWLYTIDKTGFGGILADEMGLGKSIQTIYYIKELLKDNKEYKFLIVAPTSLVYNWKNEFDKFGNSMKYEVIAGTKTNRRKKIENINNINIIITTYGLLREDKDIYNNIEFRSLIIDEAQNIKNANTETTKVVKKIKANTRLALTGTPIENSILELWSIFDFIMPGFLANFKDFESKYKIKDFDEDANLKITNLSKLIRPFILRRKKKDVIKDLPDKIDNTVYIELTNEQKKIYVKELEKVNQEMKQIILEGGIAKARFLILKLLTRLRQICIDPRIVFKNYFGGSGKMEEVINIVRDMVANGHKILIFTSFKSALELTRQELLEKGITSYVIDGSVTSKKRIELVNNFNKDNTNVFLIMLKAGGTGLNLTSADIVIHLDLWWNPQAENQATDRTHRIGQKNVVQVIKIITKGTIEEKILELQSKKKILSNKLIDEHKDNNYFNKLTEDDIRELLSYDNIDTN